MLKRDKSLHKFLISTSAKVVGEYESENVSIGLSFPIDTSLFPIQDSPFSRTFMVVTISIPPNSGELVLGGNQSYYGEIFSVLFSILLGKEFKFHGLLESYGSHRLPNMNIEPNPIYTLPFYNSSPRKDLEIPLDIGNFKLIEPFLIESPTISSEFRKKILAAGKFYNRAIRIFPQEPELAFLDLITSGEIISSFYDKSFTDEEMYDKQLLDYFKKIETLEKGESITKNIKKRLYQVKRKFTTSLLKNLNEEFFLKSETIHGLGKITKESSETKIKASYDLRSLYVHEGLEFGFYVTPDKGYHNEIVIFEPAPHVLEPKATKAISNSLSFLGLERMIRFSLLSLINKNGVPIDKKLNQ